MPNVEMKTLTIGNTTYEIVDESARDSVGDLSGLNTQAKTDLVSAINEAAESGGQVDSVNGKTGAVVLKTSDLANDSGYITGYTETDPTVPTWAKQANKPSYTAAEVGAATTGALTEETTARTAADAQLQGQITALGNGTPIPVETIAAMTEQTKAYLYTGSETGESTGYWYSYDSTQAKFVPRGEYGAGVIIDDTFTIPGAAAGSDAVGQALALKADADDVTALNSSISTINANVGDLSNLQTENKTNLVEAINEAAQTGSSGGGDTVPMNVRQAIYDLFKTALYDSDMPEYSDLQSNLAVVLSWIEAVTAINLFPRSIMLNSVGATSQLTATTVPAGGTIVWASSDESVATVSQTGLVTITGFGSCTITATCGFVSTSCSVVASSVTLSSISAVYTPSGKVYTTDTLDSLKAKLTVTAHWSDSSTSVVSAGDYVLSGTLTKGTSVITVGYGGKTDTISVTVTGRYTVTNNLTNATTSNNSTGVDDGASYTATLTAGSGYSEVVAIVTMGGTDITTTAFNNGVVSIANVTGDIVITAHGASAYLYHYPFDGSIASIGQQDFGFSTYGNVEPRFTTSGGETYLDVTSIDEVLTAQAAGLDFLDGDFTISFYAKNSSTNNINCIDIASYLGTSMIGTVYDITNLVSGHEFNHGRINQNHAGSSIRGNSSISIGVNIVSKDLTKSANVYGGSIWTLFNDGNFHHICLQRDNGVITFYLDKIAYWNLATAAELYLGNVVSIGGVAEFTDATTYTYTTASGKIGARIKDLIIDDAAIDINTL